MIDEDASRDALMIVADTMPHSESVTHSSPMHPSSEVASLGVGVRGCGMRKIGDGMPTGLGFWRGVESTEAGEFDGEQNVTR